MKYLEPTPDFICNPEDTNYCAYVDTDSNYFHAEPLLKYLYPNFDEMTESEKDDVLEEVALKYQDLITGHYDNLAKNTFNVYKFPWFKDREKDHWLEMKTECVIRSAYFRKTRRYAQWITKQEGIKKETLDIKGLEFKKSNFPPILGKFFKEALIDILKGAKQEDIDSRIKEFKREILEEEISLIDLGNPTSVKTLNKYIAQPAKAGEMFSKPAKGAPASVKSTIAYNDLLKFWGLNKKHSYISQGDKVKWIYLKPNIYQIEALSYLPFDIPNKILTFLETHADRQKIFDSILLNKLEGFYDDLGWTLNLNSNINKFFEF
jgi:DNA polymerase elongation subunit (family B)